LFFKLFFRSIFYTLLTLLLCHTSLLGLERYGAIEIGGKGVKGYVVEIDHNLATIRYRTSFNTSPQEGIDSKDVMNTAMIQHISIEVLALQQTLLNDQNISKNSLYIIASSAINKMKNKPELVTDIQNKAHLKLYFIDEKEESTYAFYGAVPKSQWNNASMIDIGGGNTKMAWINATNTLDFFEIPLGTVSLSTLAEQSQEGTFEERCTRVIRKNTSHPISLSQESVYATGGIFWATSYLKTDGKLESYVALNKADFDNVITAVSEPTPCKDENTTRCFLLRSYGAKNLIAGAILAKETLDQLDAFTKKIYFVTEGAWINGWFLQNAKNF